MNLLRRKTNLEITGDLEQLELQLKRVLIPVAPRPEFVKGLRRNLVRQCSEVVQAPKPSKLQTSILVTGGVLGFVLALLTGVRGLMSLVSVVALLWQWTKRNGSQESPKPFSPMAH